MKYDNKLKRYVFKDRYDLSCSLQDSSLANEDAIWLGIDRIEPQPGGLPALGRMHLTKADVQALLPLLQYFAAHGRLPEPPKPVATPELSIAYNCQRCRKRKPDTKSREIYTKAYEGPCGDSFCYASCELEACRPVRVVVCDGCAGAISKDPERGPAR